MANTPNLDQLQKDAADKANAAIKAQVAAQEAATAADEADAAHRSARTASFDQTLVGEARDWGINPDNFEIEDELKKAVDQVSSTREKAAPINTPPMLDTKLVQEARDLGLDPTEYIDDVHLQNAITNAQIAKGETPGTITEQDAAPVE